MAGIPSAQTYLLSNLAPTRGQLGPDHSHATPAHMDTAIAIAVDPSSYSQKLEGCVICVEDRLYPNGQRKQAPRLAGGALALGLMRNLIFGGALLSQDLQELRSLGLYVALHDDCGALRLAPELIPAELSHINAGGYRLLEALGLRIPMMVR